MKAAVFYDVDGTIVHTNILHTYVFYAIRLPKISEKAKKLLSMMLFSPLYILVDQMSKVIFNKLFYKNYKGIPEERLRIMGKELVRDALLPNVYKDSTDRIANAKKMGLTQVLVSSALDVVIKPLGAELGVNHFICNSLEMKSGIATGALKTPIVTGKEKIKAIRDFAEREGIDLKKSYAFADSKGDREILDVVGFPVAVNPDSGLRQIAVKKGWPIISFS